jgi:hypothetical protein
MINEYDQHNIRHKEFSVKKSLNLPRLVKRIINIDSIEFKTTEEWHKECYEQKLIFEIQPSIFQQYIKIHGYHWVVDTSENSCVLNYEIHIDTKLGFVIKSQILNAYFKSMNNLAKYAEEYFKNI